MRRYPTDNEARQLILDATLRLYQRGLLAGVDGNWSVKVSKHTLWCTPSGGSKAALAADDLVTAHLRGRVLAGHRTPSSEFLFRSRH